MHRCDEILEEIHGKINILKSKDITPKLIYLGREELSYLVCNSRALGVNAVEGNNDYDVSFEMLGLRILVIKENGHISVGI